MIKVQFLKLFRWVEENEIYEDSFLAVHKIPYAIYTNEDLNSMLLSQWMGAADNPVSVQERKIQHQYWCYVNLYVVRLRFYWRWPRTIPTSL